MTPDEKNVTLLGAIAQQLHDECLRYVWCNNDGTRDYISNNLNALIDELKKQAVVVRFQWNMEHVFSWERDSEPILDTLEELEEEFQEEERKCNNESIG